MGTRMQTGLAIQETDAQRPALFSPLEEEQSRGKPTDRMVADLFTKPLGPLKLGQFCGTLGLLA